MTADARTGPAVLVMKRSAPARSESRVKKAKSSKKGSARDEERAELKTVVGDAIEDGLRDPRKLIRANSSGELCFYPVSLASFRWLVGGSGEWLHDTTVRLGKAELKAIFGAKVTSRNDPARDERYGCAEAIFNWSKKNSLMDDSAGEMEVTYTPEICNGPCARVMKP